MKPHHVVVLKHVALKGGIREFVPLSTKELGALLGLSQQSASNRIMELGKLGLLAREVSGRSQRVRLTEKGVAVLKKERSEYQRIFELAAELVLGGTVVSGLGEGQYYMQQKGYREQFERKLRFLPFRGTLNLRIEGSDLSRVEILRGSAGTIIEGFRDGGRSFGDVKVFGATIGDLPCAVVMPVRSHHADVIEVISPHHLRKALKLADGDAVELRVTL